MPKKLTNPTCSMCKTPIALETSYVRCSVSSCNVGRFKLLFCTVDCWTQHLPTARHRNAQYIETQY